MSFLFLLSVLTLHRSYHRFKFFLEKLLLDVTDFPGLSLNAKYFHHLVAFNVAGCQSGLYLVLVDLDLTEVGVDDLHGMLANFGEGHYMVPVLQY
jgi:hypothetical protein